MSSAQSAENFLDKTHLENQNKLATSTKELAVKKAERKRGDGHLPRTYRRGYAHLDVPSLRNGHSPYAS